MNPEIKEKWIGMLDSGEFQKGRRTLRENAGDNEFRHCCLGVLCELHKRETGEGDWNNIGVYTVKGGGACRDYLPDQVAEWAGIQNVTGMFTCTPEDVANDPVLEYLHNSYGLVNLTLANDMQAMNYDPTYGTVKRLIEKHF